MVSTEGTDLFLQKALAWKSSISVLTCLFEGQWEDALAPFLAKLNEHRLQHRPLLYHSRVRWLQGPWLYLD